MTFTPNIHYSTDLEKAILGACLLEKTAFGRVYNTLTLETFYHTGHGQIWETLTAMYTNGVPIDMFTLADHLIRVQGRQVIAGDNTPYFISNLTAAVVSSVHLEYHAYLVKTMWMEREIIKLTSGAVTLDGDTRSKIQELQAHLTELQQKSTEHDWADMSQLMVDLYKHQDHMRTTGGMGLSTGIPEIDSHNGGFHPGQMVVLGARPSVGKSAFVGALALHFAKERKKVGIVSLEMSNTEIAARLAAIDTQTDFSVLFRGLYQDEYQSQEVYKRIGSHTSTLPIYVTDQTNVNVTDIRAKVDKLKALHGIDVVIIDYLQLIGTEEVKNVIREQQIAKISRACKIMAKELQIPVIILCQLNRDITKREYGKRFPMLSDIRESGSIEQDADVVMFLHRDSMSGFETNPETGESTEGEADLVIRKWRNGQNNFSVKMDFIGRRMLFVPRSAPHYMEDKPY